ncbi:MAG: transporter, partial [Stackebrandtia sp.]
AEQRERTRRAVSGNALMYWGPWGGAWLIGFGLFFLQRGLHGRPYLDLPRNLPLIVLFCLMGLAMLTTVAIGARSQRDLRGDSNLQGMMYGFAWFFGFVTVVAVGIRFTDFLPPDEQSVLWSGMAVGVTGTLYLAGGALWRDWSLFIMGGWLIVINAIGIGLGPGWHALLVSAAGGGGLLIGGVTLWLLDKRRGRQVAGR